MTELILFSSSHFSSDFMNKKYVWFPDMLPCHGFVSVLHRAEPRMKQPKVQLEATLGVALTP